MPRGKTLFTFFLTLVSLSLLIVTLKLPFKARVFPMIAILTALGLLSVQLFIDTLGARRSEVATSKKGRTLGRKHLSIGAWMAALLLMLWIIGFMGTVILLPFLYLRLHRETWLLSVSLSLGCGVFFYVLFGVVVSMPLYPGLLGEKIWG
jgi:hypothetical protein